METTAIQGDGLNEPQGEVDNNADEGLPVEKIIELPPRIDVLQQQHANEADQTLGQSLLQVCKDGDLEGVKKLVREGVPICFVTTTGWMPLSVACVNGYLEIVQFLLGIGAGEYYKQQKKQPTARQGNSERTKKPIHQNTPLHWACYKGHSQIVWALLTWGFSTEDADSCGNRALHLACSNGNCDIVQMILAFGADLSAKNIYGNTPLDLTTDVTCRKLLKKLQSQANCDYCKELFNRTRRPALCQQCYNIFCCNEPCSLSLDVPWDSQNPETHAVRYCKECNQALSQVQEELSSILAAKLQKVESNLASIHALELDIRTAAITPSNESIETMDDASAIISESEPEPKDAKVKLLIQALASLDSDVAEVEALKTAISDAQEKDGNARMIQEASDAYTQLTAHIQLLTEIKRVMVDRPISVRSTINALHRAWNHAKQEHVNPILLQAAQRVIVMAESEVSLYGYYMLCARIQLGSKKYINDMSKLSHVIAAVDDKGVNQTLLRNAKVLRDKLYAEMAMEEALMNFEEQGDSVANHSVFVFADGKRLNSLLEALNHRNHIVTQAVENAMKMEDTTPVSSELLDRGKELLVKLKKDIKEEQKHEEERRKLEEEAAAKAAKKGKKGKKK